MSNLLVTVVFTESGPLGLNLGSTDSGPTVLKSLTPGSLGAAQPKLAPGLVLSTVQGKSVANLHYKERLQAIKNAGRPLTLGFLRIEGAAPTVAPKVDEEVMEQETAAIIASLAERGLGMVWDLDSLGPKMATAFAKASYPVDTWVSEHLEAKTDDELYSFVDKIEATPKMETSAEKVTNWLTAKGMGSSAEALIASFSKSGFAEVKHDYCCLPCTISHCAMVPGHLGY